MSSKISFIIPIYNCEQYLEQRLAQIQRISATYEVILIDDGSTDHSWQICENEAQGKQFIRCYHQENQGVSAARNQGLKLATGEYVLFLDADDDIEPEKLTKLIDVLQENDTIDMAVYGISFDYYHAGKLYRRDELPPGLTGKVNASDWIQKIPELYFFNAISPIWNKIIKRSILTDNQLELRRDMFLYEDLEYSLRCIAHCESIYFCPDIIYHYRQSEDEGNAGRRLRRIEHLPVLIEQIELALDELIEQKNAKEHQSQMKSILLSLYLVLAREKIAVSNAAEIRQICDDFIAWFHGKNLEIPAEQQKFTRRLLNRQVSRLIWDRTYTAVRHSIAVKVKSSKLYQKFRG